MAIELFFSHLPQKAQINKTIKKYRREIITSILAVLFMMGGAGIVSAATPISSCTRIVSPGTYELTADILNSVNASCIEITSSNVVFDGKHHTIEGNGTNGVLANKSPAVLTNITVRNFKVRNWSYGINFSAVENGMIENIKAESNTVGIQLVYSNNNSLRKNSATLTPFGGMGIGIHSSKYNTFIRNRANHNDGTGIILGGTSTHNNFVGNNVSFNGDMGIWVIGPDSNHNNFTENTFKGNGFCCGGGRAGIAIGGSNYNNLTGNIFKNNLKGILVHDSTGNKLLNNVIKSNIETGINIISSSLTIS